MIVPDAVQDTAFAASGTPGGYSGGGYPPGGYGPPGGAGSPGRPGVPNVQGYGQQQQAYDGRGPQGPAGGPPAPSRGFFGALFDFSFSEFITTRIVRFLYVLYVIAVGLGFLFGMGAGLMTMAAGAGAGAIEHHAAVSSGLGSADAPAAAVGGLGIFAGMLQLVLTPVICAIALIYGRVMFECVIVFFRLAEHVGEIDRKTRG